MIDMYTTNEYFIPRFCWNILLNEKQRLKVDYMIDEHSVNESFLARF
jgi:hypothetical protein